MVLDVSPSTDAVPEPPLRRDAQRNIERIRAAALEVFREQGLGASHEVIARRADVSVGTVYRRFPDREELIDALLDEELQAVVDVAQQALDTPDAWEGLVVLLERSMELATANVALQQLMTGSQHGSHRVEHVRARLEPLAAAVMQRARDSGAIRADADTQDLLLLQLMLTSLLDASRGIATQLWRRYLAIFLDGLRPGEPRAQLPPPIDLGIIHDGVVRSHATGR